MLERVLTTTADIIIIGAGVQGVSLAFHLARRGAKALVLEKKFVAAGATGPSNGLVRMHYDVRQDTELDWISFQYLRQSGDRQNLERPAPHYSTSRL